MIKNEHTERRGRTNLTFLLAGRIVLPGNYAADFSLQNHVSRDHSLLSPVVSIFVRNLLFQAAPEVIRIWSHLNSTADAADNSLPVTNHKAK